MYRVFSTHPLPAFIVALVLNMPHVNIAQICHYAIQGN